MAFTPRAARARTAGWSVRPAGLEDAHRMAEVHVQVWRDTYTGLMRPEVLDGLDVEAGAERWRHILTDGRDDGALTLLGCDPGGRVVALSSAGPARDDDAPVGHELRAINVLRSAQGSGLADLMMEELVGDAPAYLWVVEGNDRAIAFYRRHGFVAVDARPDEPYGVVEQRMVRRG